MGGRQFSLDWNVLCMWDCYFAIGFYDRQLQNVTSDYLVVLTTVESDSVESVVRGHIIVWMKTLSCCALPIEILSFLKGERKNQLIAMTGILLINCWNLLKSFEFPRLNVAVFLSGLGLWVSQSLLREGMVLSGGMLVWADCWSLMGLLRCKPRPTAKWWLVI